ncbi:metallophosphoesterase [Bacteroides sedimenti]|uniref:Calcineurin-like phosphoesterase domain-containing protein n=1 Tax=Bacteroides sedimenti TaxID=2136147 RepID=A0ABN6Z7K7_9BACE
MTKIRPRITRGEYDRLVRWRDSGARTVLAIGDLHAPFIKEGYLEFCKEIYQTYNCTEVVFLGDLLDNHYSSYHEADPDGHGAGEELKRAKVQIAKFYAAFPNAKVCVGNHDAIPDRKAFSAGLSKNWIKSISEILETPTWEYAEEHIIDGVLYNHGIGRKARIRAKDEFISVVQGHYHSESDYTTFVSETRLHFAMQVGCGVDRRAYAMAYGRHFKKPQLNVGVIFDNGRWGAIIPMDLGRG